MLTARHQFRRTLFQLFWLVVLAALWLAGAPRGAWLGLLLAALATTLLVKRAACSFACPLFPLGELLWRTGERLFGRTFAPPFWLDLLLRTGKYLALGGIAMLFLHGEPATVLHVPYAVTFLVSFLILSLFFQMPWCRYLCPAGALLGVASIASLLKVRRSPRHCVRCHLCSQRCPAHLPVMLRTTVRSPECFTCYRCIDGCPAPEALAMRAPGNQPFAAWQLGTTITFVMLGVLMVWLLY